MAHRAAPCPSVQVQNLFKSYTVKGKDFKAVQDITLDFPANEIIALLGPSGSGKTTLLRLISGLESVTAGQIFFGGEDNLEGDCCCNPAGGMWPYIRPRVCYSWAHLLWR